MVVFVSAAAHWVLWDLLHENDPDGGLRATGTAMELIPSCRSSPDGAATAIRGARRDRLLLGAEHLLLLPELKLLLLPLVPELLLLELVHMPLLNGLVVALLGKLSV